MATNKITNNVIPIIVGVVVIIVVALFAKDKNDGNVEAMPSQEQQSVPDGDSTADTLRTLTAKLTDVSKRNEELSKSLETIKEEKVQPSPEIDEATLNEKLAAMVERQVNAFTERPPQVEEFDYDLSLGGEVQDKNELVWIEPIDEVVVMDENGQPTTVIPNSLSSFSPSDLLGDSGLMDTTAGKNLSGGLLPNNDEDAENVPIYTIPKNSTLIGSTSMSALIGRVPNNGNIEDPYPVKIITGKDNLTANGLELPEVSHMIFTGTAVGDWTLSCVRVDLTSVTYVFEDGTIRTLTAGDSNVDGSNRLAWLSDTRGIPCVSGKRISNATANLVAKIFAKGVEAAARAIAQAEETSVTSAQGDTTTSVTGDVLTNTKFKGLAGGTKEISNWLNEREGQNFDVIYVDTGVKVNINIDAELPIDYAPNGRKLRHDNITANRFSNHLD
jgi:integrating conjugative element protein (TIGR03752 family)